jgi:hypothetical protein
MTRKKQSGLALAELTLPSSIGAILLTIVGPQLSKNLIPSNERAAITALRRIASAQAQLAASGAIDTDANGVGEYGFLGELAGTAQLRVYDPATDTPDLGPDHLSPPLLPDFRDIFLDNRAENAVRLHGYWFKMFLPDVQTHTDIEGIAEDGPPGIGGSAGGLFPAPDTGEAVWCCYAWPVEHQVTGQRAFFINQEGRILQTRNDGRSPTSPIYAGLFSGPLFDAAYSVTPGPNGLTGMGAPLGSPPRRANDGNVWIPIVW